MYILILLVSDFVTAEMGDFMIQGDQFEFSAEGSISLSVTITNDQLLEFEESFFVGFHSSNFIPPGVEASQSMTQINIADDEGIYMQ